MQGADLLQNGVPVRTCMSAHTHNRHHDLVAAANIRLVTACIEDGSPWRAALPRPPKRWRQGGGGMMMGVRLVDRGDRRERFPIAKLAARPRSVM